MEHVICSDYS